MIDGASRLGALWHVVLPLSAPGVFTAGILAFNDSEIALFDPKEVSQRPERQCVGVAGADQVFAGLGQPHQREGGPRAGAQADAGVGAGRPDDGDGVVTREEFVQGRAKDRDIEAENEAAQSPIGANDIPLDAGRVADPGA